MNIKDPRWLFGFLLIVLVGAITCVIAIGHVEQATSYGLTDVLGILAVLAGGFSQWAFSNRREDDNRIVRSKDEKDSSV